MASPFCNGCGATVVEGTRFCVKCGQPVGHAAPPPPPALAETIAAIQAPPPPPAYQQPVYEQPPPQQSTYAQPTYQPPYAPPGVAEAPKQGGGTGIWLAIIGILLLTGGAGAWVYMTHKPVPTPVTQAAATPAPAVQSTPSTPAPTAPAQPATPEVIPPNPDYAKPATPEVIPPNPDYAKPKQTKPPNMPQGRRVDSAPSPEPSAPPPQPAPKPSVARVTNPTSGTLHAAVEVAQDGEVVFENLPGGRLRFIFDRTAWRPTISRQANGTQTLVMRSLKPGIQRSCDVRWEIVE